MLAAVFILTLWAIIGVALRLTNKGYPWSAALWVVVWFWLYVKFLMRG